MSKTLKCVGGFMNSVTVVLPDDAKHYVHNTTTTWYYTDHATGPDGQVEFLRAEDMPHDEAVAAVLA